MAIAQKPTRRSPLKRRPLRQAGQSVEEKRSDLIFDVVGLTMGSWVAVAFATMEWWRDRNHDQFHPWVWSAVASVVLVTSARKVVGKIRELRQYREGRDGERLVGERLDELRSDGFHALHDVVAGAFNIDHVVIGATGVFAIETKTLGKRGGAGEKAEFNGEEILIAGKPLRWNPVAQARANAEWVRTFLRESTGRAFPVTPVVMLPGWYVVARVPMRETLVLNDHPNGLRSYIVERSARLAPEDVALIKTHLALFVRKPD